MSDNGHDPSFSVPVATPQPSRRRSPIPIAIIAALFIIASFFTWYGNWFGRELSDEDIGKYLEESTKPRHVQHALIQIGERLAKGDRSVKRWYPQVVASASNSEAEIRLTAAWLMGHDNQAEEFHRALTQLLADSDPIVRRNAALSLVTFQDAHGQKEIRAILQPYSVAAPGEGTVNSTLAVATPVKRGSLLARIQTSASQNYELRSPVSGRIASVAVSEGNQVAAGEKLFTIAPDSESVWEALRALYLIGDREDLKDVERYAQEGVAGMPPNIKQQATLTAQAIESRSQNVR
jgi:hypothetical protein